MALGERRALAKAGAILGGESDTHTEGGDESDNDHALTIGACAELFQA
jgi:hypothetical protein